MFGHKTNLDLDDYVLPPGQRLSTEERLVLQVSLSALKLNNRFSSVFFQGKVLGTFGDYYVAYGRGKDYIRNKVFFYSMNGQSWRTLFAPPPDDLTDFRFTRNRFTGDPTYVHRFQLEEKKVSIREEARLSAAVHLLDWETAIGPRGALQIDHRSGWVVENRHFAGLEDSVVLASYVHHRLPKDQEDFVATRNLCPNAGDAALEFLEPITDDYPPGCWKLRDNPTHVQLHCLWWPGHTFYYCKTGGWYGSFYMGLGDRNDDLPFML